MSARVALWAPRERTGRDGIVPSGRVNILEHSLYGILRKTELFRDFEKRDGDDDGIGTGRVCIFCHTLGRKWWITDLRIGIGDLGSVITDIIQNI